MSNFLKEGEQALRSFEGQGGGNQQQRGNMGGGNSQMGSSGGNQQQQQQSRGGGGGLMKNTEDAFINQDVDKFATSEGIPSAMDGAINMEVDKEVNKFT